MIDVGSIVKEAIKPITNLVDELHTSKEEKAAIKLAAKQAVIDTQDKLMGFQKEIILAEATGESWLQRNWRPMLMCLFGFIVGWNYIIAPLGTWVAMMFDGPAFPALPFEQGFWDLLWVGVGGYILGRSTEKGIKNWRAPQKE